MKIKINLELDDIEENLILMEEMMEQIKRKVNKIREKIRK